MAEKTINELLTEVLSGIAPTSYWELEEEDGDRKEPARIQFNYNIIPDTFGDDRPMYEKYLVQVHYFCQKGKNATQARDCIKKAIFKRFGEWPGETIVQRYSVEAPKEQHYCYEFEYLEAIDWSDGNGKT